MKDVVLKGLYKILKPLKETDRSFLFEGKHVADGRDLVIKILKDRYGRNASFLERYANDLQATARLPEHANIARIHDADFVSRRFCVVTEAFTGISLGELLKRGPLPYPLALAVVRQLVTVMGFGLREGLPFRHVEMDNVLVNETSARIKVLKFTTPRSASPSATREGRSASGLGADHYLAGTLLFHALVGEPPFPTKQDLPEIEVDRLKRAIADGPTALRDEELHGLSTIFLRACTRDVSRRFATSEEFIEAIENLEKQNATIQNDRKQKERERKRASLDTAYDTVAALVGHRPLPDSSATEAAEASMEERQALGVEEDFLAGDDEDIRKRLVWKREPVSSRLGEFLAEEGPTLTTLIILLVIGIFMATLYIVLS